MGLKGFWGAAKAMRHSEALTAGLVPSESVVVSAPMPAAANAVEAALAGDHRPAADLLTRTLQDQAWDDRTHVVDVFAKASLRVPQWLDDWEASSPDDGGAALVRASAAIQRAWEHRSNARASDVTPEQFEAFHASLADATAHLQRAADLLPGDPEPWSLALIHARGLQAPPEVWLDYLASAKESAPWHYAGHYAAMELLTEKWFGSHEEMYDFAFRVASEAPAGERVRTLPLTAVLEHMVSAGPADAAARPETATAVAMAASWIADNEGRGHHVVAVHRNTLVFVLLHLGRFREAYDELVALGPHATRYPWVYYGDAREMFLSYREAAVVKTASQM